MLAEYTTKEIQHRLDRSYLESIQDSRKTAEGSSDVEAGLISALEEELESLYPEVDVLAEVSTKQQYSEPIIREVHNHHEQMRVAAHKKLDYVSVYLGSKLLADVE